MSVNWSQHRDLQTSRASLNGVKGIAEISVRGIRSIGLEVLHDPIFLPNQDPKVKSENYSHSLVINLPWELDDEAGATFYANKLSELSKLVSITGKALDNLKKVKGQFTFDDNIVS